MARYTVKGVEEVVAKLQGLKKTEIKKGIRKGSRAGCKIIAARAKDLVPVQTGALRKEIKVRAITRSRRYTGAKVTTRVAEGPTYYGGFVELGTKKMKARGFIKRAAEQTETAAGAAAVEGIRESIERALR